MSETTDLPKEEKERNIYFIILNPSEEKLDFRTLNFSSVITPSIIFNKNVKKENEKQVEEIVFKFKIKKKKKDKDKKEKGEKECIIKFFSGNHTYTISFDTKKKSFIYSPDFTQGNKYLDNIFEKPIRQDNIPYYNKLDIFLEALEKNDESFEKDKLFEDSIDLYEKKKKFSLMIKIFLKIYDKNKDLCNKLMKIFYENNDESKIKERDLKRDLKEIIDIYSNADEIIKQNEYNPVYFYGILFCYLHYYDEDKFPIMIKEFSEGNSNILYDILIKYDSHFINPLNQTKEFYDGFLKYVLKKNDEEKEKEKNEEEKEKDNLKIFERVLNYVEDIETYLYIINENKQQIFKKYESLKSAPIQLGPNLKLNKYIIDSTIKAGEKKPDNQSEDSGDDNSEKSIKNECDTIIDLIEKLIEFSKNERILAIYIKSTFWINLIKKYDISDWENINNLYKLRELFKKYNELIIFLYEQKNSNEGSKETKIKKKKKEEIKNDINRYYDRDEFAFMLNKNIKGFFDNNKNNISNDEILGTIEKYNPYFNIKDKSDDERYKNRRDAYIFDYIDFSNTDEIFIKNFNNLNFETIFENNISDFILKITGKIKDIQTFGNIIKLIDIKRIKDDKKKEYFRILKDKYKSVIDNEIKIIKNETELNKAIKIVAEFVSKLFLYENNNNFIKNKINKLNDKIKSSIYIELLKSYNGIEYQEQKNYIYNIYLNNIETKEGRDDIIKLIKKLSGDEKKFFMYEKLLKECIFTKDEFFLNQENYKIKTLCDLNKELEDERIKSDIKYLDLNELAQQGNESAKLLVNALDSIRQDLDKEKIKKKDLERFLKINRKKNPPKDKENNTKKPEEAVINSKEEKKKQEGNEEVEEKLSLITLVLGTYNAKLKYLEYKGIIDKINEKVEKLIFIKDSLIIFHKNKFFKDIQKISDTINDIENNSIINFRNEEMKKTIKDLEQHETLCNDINLVKDFLLFKKIFENAQGKDQLERFDDATKKLSLLKGNLDKNTSNIEIIFEDENFKNVFKSIKEELGKKDEPKSQLFIKQMIDYFKIENETVKKDLKILIKSKKYEMIVKSIKYFFDHFSEQKLDLPQNINLSDLKLQTLKSVLNELKVSDIYDYESTSPYYRVFTSIYEKEEAIDFFKNHLCFKKEDLTKKLITNLDPTNRSISIKDINDAMDCLYEFKSLINKNPKDILKNIKLLHTGMIEKFESFSKKYGSIIELENKTGKDNFEEVYQIIKDASLLFNLDNEDFRYTNKEGKSEKIKNIDELIKLKSKINLQRKKDEKKTNDEKNEIKEEKDMDIYTKKCHQLLFFKDIISDLEIIYDKLNILREKGFNIPIVINIKIKYPKITYKLNKNEKNINQIKEYLFTITNDYENQLSSFLETNKYLRLIYGKLFRRIRQHQGGNFDIQEMKRYLFNKIYATDTITEALNIKNFTLGEDYETQYSIYTRKIFESISNYLISLFQANKLDFDSHYENMKIKEEYKYNKGISVIKCESESMEEYILYLFQENLDKLPISQNIIICSKETSIEELQSFLYRAILCDYNTLFVLEILKSFSSFQLNKMYGYIDKLLSIKLEKYKKSSENFEKKRDVDKEKSRIYLDSYIIFVYKDLKNESAFKNELKKYSSSGPSNLENEIENEKDDENKIEGLNISNISKNSIRSVKDIKDNELLKNIKVITSDVCGLGKSFKIKKMAKLKKLYHFPLGGKLTKNIIYQKIFSLFEKIKKDAKEKLKKTDKEKKEYNLKKVEDYSEFNNVAIHLDLIETKEIPLINEFLFSFLITKFYTNNENIIYIPNNIDIYIEVPNSSENYLAKFGILKSFYNENIELGKLEPLELEPDIIKKFKKLNGIEKNEIENFIKAKFEKIGINNYSYHQVNTFIKLYLSLFDSKNEDITITQDCINYFVESSKYFVDGGFSKLIMKKLYNKDELEKAYKSDLDNDNFDVPLIFIDTETKSFKLEKLPVIDKTKVKKKVIKKKTKDVDIVYLIDGTGSMYPEISAAKKNVINIFDTLTKNYKDYDFRFGAVFYRDKVHQVTDKDEFFQFTNNMKELEENIGKIRAYGGGGDGPEDWDGGYELALNKMKWREGIKLIIHIADAGGHGTEFSEGDLHPEEGKKLIKKIEECVDKNINIIGFKVKVYGCDDAKQSFNKMREVYNDYKMKLKDNNQFIEIYDFEREDKGDSVSQNFNKLVMKAANQVLNPSYKYLEKLKKILNLQNDLENSDGINKSLLYILDIGIRNYVITDDNYKKMVLLYYRIKANVPVIIMGETGCGKTSLIIKLSHILNNGEQLVEVINIHPGITDEEIIRIMIDTNNKAKNKYKNKEFWVFFDEINTCLSLSLLTEIFINRTFNGEKLENNIRLIGACNPYRYRKQNIERCGLMREDDEDSEQLVYKVEKLPESLLYYVFSFGSLQEEDEKKYIKSIIQILFTEEEEKLHDLTTEAISMCHIFLRKSFGDDPSIVSLREIARFTKSVEFFEDYFLKKYNFLLENSENKPIKLSIDDRKKLYKIKSIICSIYLCYYIRLTNEEKRANFENELQEILLRIANAFCPEIDENQEGDLFSKIRDENLEQELREQNFTKFSDLLKIEETFLLDQIELDKGIGKNQLLKENLFMLFLAVVTKIPLIIVGKPGTGKSLSAQLINNSMRGKYSKPKNGKKSFFMNYPQINQIYFQGSKSTTPEDIEELFKKADDLYNNFIKNNKKNCDSIPIYMILFDELGLAENSSTNPLKVLHSKLEYDGKKEGTCFVGISNYSLDAAKINRALSLSVPNLEDKLDQLKATSKSIIESVSEDIYQDNLIFNILARAYSEYKDILIFIKKLTVLRKYFEGKDKMKLKKKNFGEIEVDPEFLYLFKRDKKIKTEFHGNRDFYNIIKGVAIEGSKLSNISDQSLIVPIINNFIERNFGGISYNINIDFTYEFEDIKGRMIKLRDEILKEKLEDSNNQDQEGKNNEQDIKITSVFLFKKIFNEACILESIDNNINGKIFQISKDDLIKYNLNKCINDNINDNNSRYLLLEIRQNLAPLIIQNIRLQNTYKDKIDAINGSPFSDDNNNDYKAKKVGEIQNYASQKDKLIVLQNLDEIQAYLYDLYNMNYKVIDDQKYVRICLDNFSEQLTKVNDTFKIIVLVDKKFVNKVDMAFLNRLEKIQISFRELLEQNQKEIIQNIHREIRLKESINDEKDKFNYDLNSLLINCNEQDIGGLVYYLFLEAKKNKKENNNDIEERIYNKMSVLLPEDIILTLDSLNPLKIAYFEKKKYNNFNQYIKDLENNNKDLINFKI